jgi:uncharacterized membrane protein YcaP (DUF421 family)
MNYLSWKFKRLERIIEGKPKVLIRHGKRNLEMMRREHVTLSELKEAMRRQECSNIDDVRIAILENDGKISILKRHQG